MPSQIAATEKIEFFLSTLEGNGCCLVDHDIYLVGLASMRHVSNILLYLDTYVVLPHEAVAVALMT